MLPNTRRSNCVECLGYLVLYKTKCEIELDKPKVSYYHKCRECVDNGIKFYLRGMKDGQNTSG